LLQEIPFKKEHMWGPFETADSRPFSLLCGARTGIYKTSPGTFLLIH